MAFLDSYMDLLSDAQREEIEVYIKTQVRQGEIRGQEDFSRTLAAALAQVTSDNIPISKVTPVTPLSRTNAEIYNDFMGNFLIDIKALFRECNLSDYFIGLEEASNKDFQDTALSLLKSIRGEFNARKSQLSADQGYASVFYEPFNDPTQRVLDGAEFHRGELRIAPRSSESHAFELERVEILRYPRAGTTYITDPEFDPELNPLVLAPGASRGYWAEMALTDEAPTVEFRSDTEIPMDRKFNGILAICRVTFSTPVSLNALGLDPYCEFDLTIPWLRYRPSTAGSWQYLTQDSVRVATSGGDYIYLGNIDRALVKVLEIPILQSSSSLINTSISVNDDINLELFQNLIRGDVKQLEYEVDKYLSDKSSNTSYKKALTRLISAEDVETAAKEIFRIIGLTCRQVKFTSGGVVGSQKECPIRTMPTRGKPLQNAYLYGL